jgi:glycosyltransferase involved in cell wall biosynthesis
VSENSPALSIGLAVRNGRHFVGRCIESILSQDFTDLELVISDNASDDGTIGMLEGYARADRRLRLNVNQVNIGLHENMRRVLDSHSFAGSAPTIGWSRGAFPLVYVRWRAAPTRLA